MLTEELIKRLSGDPFISGSLPKEEILKTNNLKFKVYRVVSEFQKYRAAIISHRKGLVEKCNQVNELRDRILNHGAHPTGEPLFAGELAEGIETIESLQNELKGYLEWFKKFEKDILKFNA